MKKAFAYIIVAIIAIGAGTSVRYIQTYGINSAGIAQNQVAGTLFAQKTNDQNAETEPKEELSSQENLPVPDQESQDLLSAADVGESDSASANNTENNTPATPTDTQTPAITAPAEDAPGIANLVVSNIVVTPNPMNPNAKVRITATIENTGAAAAQKVLGRLENTTNGYQMGAHPPYDFAPGQRFIMWEEDDSPFFATCSNGGTNVLRFTIDFNNTITERSETDNSRDVTVQLLGC